MKAADEGAATRLRGIQRHAQACSVSAFDAAASSVGWPQNMMQIKQEKRGATLHRII